MGPDVRAVLTRPDAGPDLPRPALNHGDGSHGSPDLADGFRARSTTGETDPAGGTALYRVVPWVVVRTPLLPVDRLPWVREPERALADPGILRALAIGSPTLLDKARRPDSDPKEAARTRASLARYLIRMSTRPTPYGGFAAVSLARWADRTDLRLGADHTRTRPDMGWLRGLLADRSGRGDVRATLCWRTDPLAVLTGDRLLAQGGGSVRATVPARSALAEASEWIGHDDLVARVSAGSGGTADQVAGLIDQLAQAGLLQHDLVPAVTGAAATSGRDAAALAVRVDPELAQPMAELSAAIAAADRPDATPEAFGLIRTQARAIHDHPETFQTDLARDLLGRGLSAEVGRECARAVEVMLRIGPGPSVGGDLAGYTRRFAHRWDTGREVPLTEVFDPSRGLGPLPHTHGGAAGLDPVVQARRSERLNALALDALHDDRRVIELDSETVAALSRQSGRRTDALDGPTSLDVSAFLLSDDPDAVDAGRFTLVIGPNLGAPVAGRWLGRFADLCEDADGCYDWLLGAETDADPGTVAAEVVYLPDTARSTNVVLRPTIGRVEIVVSGRGSAEHQLPLADLLVGHDGSRLYLRSRSLGVRLRPTARHMLNHHGAPPVCQFLDAVGQGIRAEFTTFDWGASESLPVLPRVQVGRTVLAPARWLVAVPGWTKDGVERRALDAALDRARDRWGLPDRVYATVADNRLLLDLRSSDDREQLRREFRTSGGTMRLQEALPDVDDAWVPGPSGRHLVELVVSLVRQPTGDSAGVDRVAVADAAAQIDTPAVPHANGFRVRSSLRAEPVAVRDRLRLPGSDWLFAKFYAPYDQLTRLLVTDLADLIDMAENSGLARRWFFLRYSDPEPHLRIRWQGEPDLLIRHLLPQVNDFAAQLLDAGRITALAIDSYDREIERYGGPHGLALCEDAFHADSAAVRRLLALPGQQVTDLLVVSTAGLLSGLGLDRGQRVAFYETQAALVDDPQVGRTAGADYRERKSRLRALLDGTASPTAADALESLQASMAPIGRALAEAERAGTLDGTVNEILPSLLHMHHNRMVGPGQPTEPHLVQLLLRSERGLLLSGSVDHGDGSHGSA